MTHRNGNIAKFGMALLGFACAALVIGSSVVAPSKAADASASQSAASPPLKCLDGHHIGRIHVVNGTTLLVYDSWGNAFKLDIGDGPCRSMSDLSHIGFEFNGSDQICAAHDAQILYSETNERPLHCLINGVASISKDDAKALDK